MSGELTTLTRESQEVVDTLRRELLNLRLLTPEKSTKNKRRAIAKLLTPSQQK